MQLSSNFSYPPDISLLLRAYAEQRWLTLQVVPVLNEIECPGAVPEEQLGAALAYLEVLWMDARSRAAATESALAGLLAATAPGDTPAPASRVPDDDVSADPLRRSRLDDSARSYHALVRCQREAIGERVRRVSGCFVPFAARDLHAAF